MNRNITPYSLRHSFKTNLIGLLDEYIVAAIMGHSIGKMPHHYNNPTVRILKEGLIVFKPYRKILNKVFG